jgi:hypothetical protein
MKPMKKATFLAGVVCLFSCLFFSCKKDNSNSHLDVKLTDAPASYDAVNIDVREVWINMRSDSTGWIKLNANANTYNLLSLQNGVDTTVATGTIPTGNIQEIRFVLGSDNSIVVDGVTFPLTIPSGQESGLKIKINKKISTASEELVIDFDAAMSVSLETGAYKLRPVLRVK